MKQPDERDLIDVLACEIGVRPRGAPTFEDLAPHVRGVRRTTSAIVVAFDDDAFTLAEGLVAAERLCCPDIRWELPPGPQVELRIIAAPRQLDVLYDMLTARA
ncbi:MAG: hypothetical protein WD359_01910 [Dehalococcoidia bacterium]